MDVALEHCANLRSRAMEEYALMVLGDGQGAAHLTRLPSLKITHGDDQSLRRLQAIDRLANQMRPMRRRQAALG